MTEPQTPTTDMRNEPVVGAPRIPEHPPAHTAQHAPNQTPERTKREMIEAIRERNRSAEPEFLSSFDEPTPASYLQRLTHLANRRGRQSVWVRDGSTRSVVTRIPH